MIALWAWIIKFFGGFAIWRPAIIGKVIWLAVWFTVFVWVAIWIGTKTQVLKIEKIEHYHAEAEHKKDFFLGVKILKFGFGIFVE